MRHPNTLPDVEDELEVALKARQELGKDHEDEVIESFLSRVRDKIDARVEARVSEVLQRIPARRRFISPSDGRIRVALGFVAVFLAMAIPLASVAGELAALVAVAGGIVFGAAILVIPEGEAPAVPGPGERGNK